VQLSDALVELGDMDQALDEVIGLLQQTESDLQQLDIIYADPRHIETHLKKLQVNQFVVCFFISLSLDCEIMC